MPQQPTEFAAFIGIDWADKKHDFCLQVAGESKRERGVLEHRPAAIEAWAAELRERFGGAPVAVAVELARGPIVSALLEYDFFVVFPINLNTLAKYRTAFTPSRAKDDPTDAEIALELLVHHRDKLTPLQPQSANMRALQRLVEARRGLVHDRVRITNRITSALKEYFPQPVEWFRDKETEVFAAFLQRWPTLPAVQRAHTKTLVDFFHAHHVRYPATVEQRIAAIRAEKPLTLDPAVIGPAKLLVQSLLPQLRAVSEAIASFDAEIQRLCGELPDYDLFRALPGAGPVLSARLLAAFGEQRDRFPTAYALQCFAGVAPVTERSGKKNWVHWRYSCNVFTRQSFVEWRLRASPSRSGPGPSTSAPGRGARPVTPPSAPWLSSGSASCSGAGKTAARTTSRATSPPCRTGSRPC
jgi:transposase